MDPYLKRRRPLVATNRVSKAHLSITFSGTPVKEPSDPWKSPFLTNIHGLLRGFFNQPKPASNISTTYKLRDVPFPMAEEGCKLEGLGQDILHLDRRCSALSVGPSTWVCYKEKNRTKRIILRSVHMIRVCAFFIFLLFLSSNFPLREPSLPRSLAFLTLSPRLHFFLTIY